MPVLKEATKAGLVNEQFKERLMLAVTEVNGCIACSFEHTRLSLESGMTAEEIESLLAGEFASVPTDELPAVMFAQHYADSRGCPSEQSLARLTAEYGSEKAAGILASIKIIMAGNVYGIPLGSLIGRIKRTPASVDPRSNVAYEIAMALSLVPFVPVVIAIVLASRKG